VGKVVQPLQSVNCHDSRAHDHERHGPFTRLVRGMVGMVLFGFIWVQLVWFMVCNRCEACVHGSWFGYRWDACELCWFGYRWDACELYWFWLQVGCL
jgi:hypothetical protein